MATKPKTTRIAGAASKKAAPAKAVQKTAEVATEASAEAGADASKVLRGRDLIVAVTVATGAKKTLVKDIVTATLAAMGDALAEGRTLNLPPLGKAHVSRSKERGGAEVMVVKLRRGGRNAAAPKASDAVAETLAEQKD